MNLRSEVYHYLAEALSEPPEWLSRPGPDWPLYELLSRASEKSVAARQSIPRFEEVPAGSRTDRNKRYRSMITGEGRRVPIALYESLFRCGRIAGPEMIAVDRIYREHGLSPQSNELPDHASLELAFLAHLVEMDAGSGDRRARERSFIKDHAGSWLKDVGRQMAETGDPVYAPIGHFLADWLQEAENWPPIRKTRSQPVLSVPAKCILCGFCAQVCPTQALVVLENQTETILARTAAGCTGCRKCVNHCQTGALSMDPRNREDSDVKEREILLKSDRIRCVDCEAATISTAEYDYLVSTIGQQPWLRLCLDCRA